MEEPAEETSQSPHCPGCGQMVEPAAVPGEFPQCPHCGAALLTDDSASEAEAAEHPKSDSADSELNGVRIQQITALRRGAIRARSWCLIAAGVCLVGAIQLVIFAGQRFYRGYFGDLRAIGFALFAILGLAGAGFFLLRAARLKEEIDKPALDEPITPPDFSALSDGSQRLKNLEEVE